MTCMDLGSSFSRVKSRHTWSAIEEISKMTLRLPDHPPTVPDHQHRHDPEEIFADSSDLPQFSSDPPVFTTSMDDYQQPSRKRQRMGAWYEMDEAIELQMKKSRRHPGLRRSARTRQPYRKFDSGVFMGSDESQAFGSSDSPNVIDVPNTRAESVPKDEGLDIDDEDVEGNIIVQQLEALIPDFYSEDQLFEKAAHTLEDPGDFKGPVFPYWDEQPANLEQFHFYQKYAHDKVLECVDLGTQFLDLSNIPLKRLRAPTLQPLRFHIGQPLDRKKASSKPPYQPLTANLNIRLSNAGLTTFPSPLSLLANLTTLSLFNNNLTSLPPGLRHLSNLHTLNVASNQLRYLPYEIRHMNDHGKLRTITCHPNPFLKPVLPGGCEAKNWLEDCVRDGEHHLVHFASTAVSYLDINGRSIRSSSPLPSQQPSFILSLTRQSPITESLSDHPPSLLELSLRTLVAAPELSQLPFHLPPTLSPHLNALLKQTFHLRESGRQRCTIPSCNREFVVPRTEWVEWHSWPGREAVPFLRRGCCWGCGSGGRDESVASTKGGADVRCGVGWTAPEGGEVVVPERYAPFL